MASCRWINIHRRGALAVGDSFDYRPSPWKNGGKWRVFVEVTFSGNWREAPINLYCFVMRLLLRNQLLFIRLALDGHLPCFGMLARDLF